MHGVQRKKQALIKKNKTELKRETLIQLTIFLIITIHILLKTVNGISFKIFDFDISV